MKRSVETLKYASEADLCDQFISYAGTKGWVCYPETASWDILLVRKTDGYQIGVQAKMQANLEVLTQAVRHDRWRGTGPDFHAVLVPVYSGKIGLIQDLAPHIAVTVIAARGPGPVDRHNRVKLDYNYGYGKMSCFDPDLPAEGEPWQTQDWFERCPEARCRLPEYVPDVQAGVPAPVQLTAWKIAAIKIAILLERRGVVTRADFKSIGIDHRRWIAAGPSSILTPDPPRGFKQRPEGKPGMGFREEHPRNYVEIAADFEKWAPTATDLL